MIEKLAVKTKLYMEIERSTKLFERWLSYGRENGRNAEAD